MSLIPQRRPVTREAITEVYADYAECVARIAANFARRYHTDPDETHAWAVLHFLEAYHAHDPRGTVPLASRVSVTVWGRLMDALRTELIRNRGRIPFMYDEVQNPALPAVYDPVPFETEEFMASVSEDAEVVLRLLLGDSPPAFDARLRADPRPGTGAVRRCLRAYLTDDVGWTPGRVAAAFAEIRTALS